MTYIQNRLTDLITNQHLLKFYASKKCKTCLGRGIQTISVPADNGNWENTQSICSCVKKAIKKESNDG